MLAVAPPRGVRVLVFAVPALLAASAIDCKRAPPPGDAPTTLPPSVDAAAGPGATTFAATDDVEADAGAEGGLAAADATIAPDPEANLPRLAAKAQITWIYSEARPGSQKLGYLRAGAIVRRDEKPTSEDGCSKGWYGVAPRGYVCAGDNATIDMDDPMVKMLTGMRRPDLTAPLPYAYGVARNGLAPFYARIPTHEEALRLESGLDEHLAKVKRLEAADAGTGDAGPEWDAGVYSDKPPWFLENKHVVPNVSGFIKSSLALNAGRPRTKEGFAIVATFVSGPGGAPPDGGIEDRKFDLTTDYLLIPHDRMRPVRPSTFHGVRLGEGGDGEGLPVAFTRPRHHISKIKLEGGGSEGPLPPRTPIFLTGASKRANGAEYYETKDGFYVMAEDVIRIDPPKSFPGFANKGEKWIDVSILHQALVAYEGTKPVYATLVSTGRDGLGDPETGLKATIRGVYRIGTKHATITMDSDESGEEFSLRDVPFVQYFEAGYALHGAYWHDGFGEPRSHGCINLAELDAMWLFAFTGPELPSEWHGVMARPLATGT
ncbi:MAG: L,D-transpeptidase, partial [Polyangiales bacterium]